LQNTITLSLVPSVTLGPGYAISIFGLDGAQQIDAGPLLKLRDNSGGCQHQNLFTSSSNSTELGYGIFDSSAGTLQIYVAKSLNQVMDYKLAFLLLLLNMPFYSKTPTPSHSTL
jgi:hypothetical protein